MREYFWTVQDNLNIGLITGNSLRHNALGSYLKKLGHEVLQISEVNNSNKTKNSSVIENYFQFVDTAEKEVFNASEWHQEVNEKILINKGELNSIPSSISPLLKCEFIVVYGSSFIKGELYDLLSKKNTINLHIGISPQYTGSACNFWAMFDDNLHLVGGTIQKLSKRLDEGRILKYCYPNISEENFNPFLFSMEAVRETFKGIEDVLNDYKKYIVNSIPNDSNKLIRYSKMNDFNIDAVKKFEKKEFTFKNIEKIRP